MLYLTFNNIYDKFPIATACEIAAIIYDDDLDFEYKRLQKAVAYTTIKSAKQSENTYCRLADT